jgi:hypothetical protein
MFKSARSAMSTDAASLRSTGEDRPSSPPPRPAAPSRGRKPAETKAYSAYGSGVTDLMERVPHGEEVAALIRQRRRLEPGYGKWTHPSCWG